MYLLYTVIAGLVSYLILKWMKMRRYCTDVKRLDGKTVLITGKEKTTALLHRVKTRLHSYRSVPYLWGEVSNATIAI